MIVTYCQKGQRGYLAACLLQGRRFESVANLRGGFLQAALWDHAILTCISTHILRAKLALAEVMLRNSPGEAKGTVPGRTLDRQVSAEPEFGGSSEILIRSDLIPLGFLGIPTADVCFGVFRVEFDD
jgi:hypothetical protein